MKQRITTLIALLCTFAGTASATTKTYTVTGGQGGTQAEFYAQFSDGSNSSSQVNWTYNSTAEISFSLPGGLTLKLSNTAEQLVYSNGAIGGRGSTTLTVSSTTYIYHVRILDSSGNVIQLDANGEAVAHDGVAECDYWNMTKSFSHTFSNGILFSKIEVSYATAIPITDAVITGLSSQYIVSNTAIMPTPTVIWHGQTLTSGTHYTLSYLNNTAAGTATVTATGKGIFSSSTSVSANYTLVWATYSVRFNKNNDAATGTMANQAFTYNTAQALTANAFSRTGYTFAAWNRAANGSGSSYSDQQEVQNLTATNGATVNLYAQWTPITYSITYDLAGGTVITANPASYSIESNNFTLANPTRTGYTFAGWTGTGLNEPAMEVTIPTGSTEHRSYTAQWTPITYTLRLHHNDGTGAYTDMAMTYDQSKNIQSISRTGYTFDGWSTTADGAVVYTDQQEVSNLTATDGGTVDLYAQWTAITYSITYDLAGGTVATANPTSYSIESNNFTLANPTRTGYTFAGWTGTGLNEATMEVTIPTGSTEHRSYTATWTAHTYSVHFDKNSDGATGTIADQAFTYGVSHQLTANAFTAPLGYQFYRWTTNADGSGDSYTNQQEINNLTAENGATLTLYAQWEVVPWSGTGSSKTPYIISYPSQLDLLATLVNSGNEYRGEFFKLGADIAYDPNALDANGENYTAIGNRTYGFRGTFDGDGHTVSGIRINKIGTTNADRCQGLFGNVGILGTVQNVILDDAHIIGYNQVGGITGSMSSATIKNCLVLNTAIIATYANSSNVGAISGFNSGTLTANYYHNCSLTKGGTTSTTNIGSGGNSISDLDGARSVHVLTLPDGVGATGVSVVIDGTTYYASNTTVTLTYTGEVPTGYHVAYSVNGTPIEGSSFTMPAADATVTVTLTDVWNIANYADGSQEHPYVITTTAGLDLLAKNVNGTDGYTANDFNGKYFVLDSDISYTHTTDWNNAASTENNYTAIGGRFNDNNIYFCGTFDGQGHTVSGIRIYKGGATEADSYQGLFGKTEGATIRNVILADARITGNKDVGGIAGFIIKNYNDNGGIVENCRVSNNVTIHAVANSASYHGGVVGYCNGGTISGCVSSATLTVAGGLTNISYYGGIVGYEGSISNCLAVGVAIPDVTRSGAIAGDIGSRVLSNNFYSGCTLGGTPTASGIGVGRDSYNSVRHDVTANNGAVPYTTLHTLTLGENITATGALLNQGGTISVPAGSKVTLSYSGLGADQIAVFRLNDNELSGNSFTMPAADATVSASAFTAWGTDKGADGSAEHPYVITRAQELNLLAERVNSGNDFSGKYFVLDADIAYNHTTDWNNANSTENNYTPIGGVFDSKAYWFRGTFDGQGHTVSGIRIYKGNATEADSYQGLFGMTQGVTIRNVILADARITGNQFVGGIAGDIGKYDDNGSIVENCCVGNDVTIHAVANSASYHGGVVGYCHASTIISGCVSSATLTVADRLNGIYYYGGIVGSGSSTSNCFANCLAVGVAIPDVTCSGAIAGFTDSRVLSNNFYSGCTLGGTPTASGIGVGRDDYNFDNFARCDVTTNNGAVPALRDQASNTQAIALLAVLAQADAAHPLLPLDLGWGLGKFPLQLADRTLYKDGDWNTLCLPFSLTAEQIAASPLAGAEARTLSSASYADGELTLNFSEPVQTLTAGTPYIIRWEKANDYVDDNEHNIVNPTFSGVTVDNTARNVETANVTFTGTYDPITFNADNRSILFLGTNNTLYYPESGASINPFRAYFQLNGLTAADINPNNVKMFFGDERPTDGVGEVQGPKFKVQGEDTWSDLNGRRINGKPAQKGIYINNGHKVVIK